MCDDTCARIVVREKLCQALSSLHALPIALVASTQMTSQHFKQEMREYHSHDGEKGGKDPSKRMGWLRRCRRIRFIATPCRSGSAALAVLSSVKRVADPARSATPLRGRVRPRHRKLAGPSINPDKSAEFRAWLPQEEERSRPARRLPPCRFPGKPATSVGSRTGHPITARALAQFRGLHISVL